MFKEIFYFGAIRLYLFDSNTGGCQRNMILVLITLFASIMLEHDVIATEIPGKHDFGMRTRFQEVDDNWLKDAQAFTTRLKLTSRFSLDHNEQWQLLVEPNLAYAFNDGDYNSVTVKKSTSPIPDPQSFNWSQINLQYASDSNWQITLGRQPLAFDNERHIGTVEFWQTPQSFDALTYEFNDQVNWHLQYSYTNKVHRIFGHEATSTIPKDDIRYGLIDQRPANELGAHRLSAHLVNLTYKTEDNLSLVSYGYSVENKDLARFSTHTLGVRISDEFKPEKIKYRYTVEFATQQNAYNNPVDYRAWYSLLEAGIQYKSHRLQLSQEVLSENNWQGFITPLGTNHKFQGWADIFTGYGMQTGLRDHYLTYQGRYKKLRWRSVFHRFKNYKNGSTIGNEFDLELAYRATRKWEFKLVYADYKTKQGLYYFPKANHNLSTWFVSVAYNI